MQSNGELLQCPGRLRMWVLQWELCAHQLEAVDVAPNVAVRCIAEPWGERARVGQGSMHHEQLPIT
jgi:hypothetical protein